MQPTFTETSTWKLDGRDMEARFVVHTVYFRDITGGIFGQFYDSGFAIRTEQSLQRLVNAMYSNGAWAAIRPDTYIRATADAPAAKARSIGDLPPEPGDVVFHRAVNALFEAAQQIADEGFHDMPRRRRGMREQLGLAQRARASNRRGDALKALGEFIRIYHAE